MSARSLIPVCLFVLAAAHPAVSHAQAPLSLADAMQRARTSTPEARALAAAQLEAVERVRQARSGYLPRVDITESVQRGNQPVFVFSSLLSQRRFSERDFAIPALNEPDAITNVRTAVVVEQSIFDAGRTRFGVREAQLGRELASVAAGAGAQDLALGAARAFVDVLRIEALQRAAEAAVTAAQSDLDRARARREAGLSTPADVLTGEVHLADARQREITARADLAVARLRLAVAIGTPGELGALERPSLPAGANDTDALLQAALGARHDVRRADLALQLAQNARSAARASFLPAVGAQGGVEFNGGNVADQRSSWFVGAQVQVNVFRGFADSARLAGASQAEIRAREQREALRRQVELDVRAAVARLDAARAREEVGRAALAQAREAHRIMRDRYDSGLATMTDVLQSSRAAFEAEARAAEAELEVVLQSITLDHAVGRL